jgi:hypothetical protein
VTATNLPECFQPIEETGMQCREAHDHLAFYLPWDYGRLWVEGSAGRLVWTRSLTIQPLSHVYVLLSAFDGFKLIAHVPVVPSESHHLCFQVGQKYRWESSCAPRGMAIFCLSVHGSGSPSSGESFCPTPSTTATLHYLSLPRQT